MMQGAAVMWTSARQRSIALSSAEAEMVAASDAARDVRYMRRLLASIAFPVHHPTPLYVDNASALQWANKKAKWSASRHIAACDTGGPHEGYPRRVVACSDGMRPLRHRGAWRRPMGGLLAP